MKEINFNRIQIPEDIQEANLAINQQFEEDIAPNNLEEANPEELVGNSSKYFRWRKVFATKLSYRQLLTNSG